MSIFHGMADPPACVWSLRDTGLPVEVVRRYRDRGWGSTRSEWESRETDGRMTRFTSADVCLRACALASWRSPPKLGRRLSLVANLTA
jgi:hypothetical protein